MNGLSRYAIWSLLLPLWAVRGYAQAPVHHTDTSKHVVQQYTRPVPKGPKPIKHEASVGYRLNSDGWGVYTDFGTVKSRNIKTSDMFHDVKIFQLEFTEKKSPRQVKTVVESASGGNSGSYIYGKINNFYALKLGYGYRKMLAGKPDPGSVSIHWVNMFGLSMGMLKPYYLNVNSDPVAIKYSDATKKDFLSYNLIDGSAGFSKGLSEMKFIAGGHFKSALHFDFSANRTNVIGAETGINVEYYSEDIPIMYNEKAVPYFVDIFIAVQFGKRW